jgi:DNA processing protein
MHMDDASDDRESWLLLWRVPGIGPATFFRLLEHFGSPRAVLQAPAAQLREAGLGHDLAREIRSADTASIAADLRWLAGPCRRMITCQDSDFPSRLREIAVPPPLLFVEGDPAALSRPQLAIVGSRRPSRPGRELAAQFAAEVAERGVVVTSGLAHGIDAEAHRGCLVGGCPTIAVMGTGPDVVYPRAQADLAAAIRAHGALVTEFSPGALIKPENFPRRNRIISGLSLGVLVIEAAALSGSLITARHAMEQGREVFAVPGSIHNPLARGCHWLIRQGAKLVESVEDILEELPPVANGTVRPACSNAGTGAARARGADFDGEQSLMLEAMAFDPVSVDVLVDRTGLTANVVSSILLELELRGSVAPHPGGLYVRLGREKA